jgi:hypothetical protein
MDGSTFAQLDARMLAHTFVKKCGDPHNGQRIAAVDLNSRDAIPNSLNFLHTLSHVANLTS